MWDNRSTLWELEDNRFTLNPGGQLGSWLDFYIFKSTKQSCCVHLSVLACVFYKRSPVFGFDCERQPHGARTFSGMPAAAVKPTPEDMVAEGGGEGVPQWDASTLDRERLPLPSLKVPRELLRSFPHSKRVGSYLVGKMINKGSFAKVMEGLHIGTGEKVSALSLTQQLVRGDKTRRGSGWRRHTDKGGDHTHGHNLRHVHL